MYLDGQIADHRQMEPPSPVPPRDDGSRPVRVRVGEGSDLSLESGESGPAALFHPPKEVLECIVEPSECFLCDMAVDPADAVLVVGSPSREVAALVDVGGGPPLLPPCFLPSFERVVPEEP